MMISNYSPFKVGKVAGVPSFIVGSNNVSQNNFMNGSTGFSGTKYTNKYKSDKGTDCLYSIDWIKKILYETYNINMVEDDHHKLKLIKATSKYIFSF